MIRIKTENKLQEIFDYLHKGLYRIALPLAEQAYINSPDDSDAVICYAWALLETGNPVKTEQLLNKSRGLSDNTVISRLYRGFLELRLSNFEAGLHDLNLTEGLQKELLALTYLNKAKGLFAIGNYDDAETYYELAVIMAKKSHPEWQRLKPFFTSGELIRSLETSRETTRISELLNDASGKEQYWFTNILAGKLSAVFGIENLSTEHLLIYLESLYRMNQIQLLESVLQKLGSEHSGIAEIKEIRSALNRLKSEADSAKKEKNEINKYLSLLPNPLVKIKSVRLFDASLPGKGETLNSLKSFSLNRVSVLGIVTDLSFLNKTNHEINEPVFLAWYSNDTLLYQSSVSPVPDANSGSLLITDYCDITGNMLWQYGEARVECFLQRIKIFELRFEAADFNEYVNDSAPRDITSGAKELTDQEDLLADLDKLTGLEEVKSEVKKLSDYLMFLKERQEIGLSTKSSIVINAVFSGNPGTGKTTVARLMGKIYKKLGLLSEGDVIEADRSSIVGQYVGETAKLMDGLIEKAKGNILFIDEAYTLIKKGVLNDFGQEAIDTLLKRMEDKRGEFFVIAAGYPELMQEFLDSNPGLRSRFTHTFHFEDYKPDELLKIFAGYADEEEYKISPGSEKILMQEFIKVYRNRDSGFGNARYVRRVFEEIKIEAGRIYAETPVHLRDKSALMYINENHFQKIFHVPEKNDRYLLRPDEEKVGKIAKEISGLKGLTEFKSEVSSIIRLADFYAKSGEDLREKFSSHILFLGNPGTGKTTAARLLAQLFSALGILEGGHLIEAAREDMVAPFIGQTAVKTNKLIDRALGGTLFIDEAYTLKSNSPNDFGQEAIDTLLRRMENDRGKFIVIAAGYTDEMQTFLESNSGLASRFSTTFTFGDYTPDELWDILFSMAISGGYEITEEAESLLKIHFTESYRTRKRGFGNARFVRNLYDLIIKKATLRIVKETAESYSAEYKLIITGADVKEVTAVKHEKPLYRVSVNHEKLETLLLELNSLTGLSNVKSQVESLVNSIRISKLRSERGLSAVNKSLHSVFAGNPGTGKTTVARLLSRIYRELGVISGGHLVEVDRAALVAGFTGQTALKTEQIINQAIGGTLFIDEAYTLSRGGSDFGQEAIDTLLKKMEYLKENLIVIAAGYTAEMNDFLSSNPGLTSRFANKIIFEDYLPEELFSIAMNLLNTNGYLLEMSAENTLRERLLQVYNTRDKNFGNARTVRNIVYEAIGKQENRLSKLLNPDNQALTTLIEDDFH